jgi:uracil-DNA glycosylase family 4
MNLDDIALKIMSCQLCDLSTSRIKAVPGEGPGNASIMLIGEAPGADEDSSGRPFVGRAGRILDRSLDLAGIDRSKIFITSIAKCRPPGNRRPKRSEMQACHMYIQSQMDIICPNVIGLMGNVAAKAILNMQGVNSLRGQIFQGRFMITFHPAAVLRNANLQDAFVSDLTKIKDMAEMGKV